MVWRGLVLLVWLFAGIGTLVCWGGAIVTLVHRDDLTVLGTWLLRAFACALVVRLSRDAAAGWTYPRRTDMDKENQT
jgi:hypothetical protein